MLEVLVEGGVGEVLGEALGALEDLGEEGEEVALVEETLGADLDVELVDLLDEAELYLFLHAQLDTEFELVFLEVEFLDVEAVKHVEADPFAACGSSCLVSDDGDPVRDDPTEKHEDALFPRFEEDLHLLLYLGDMLKRVLEEPERVQEWLEEQVHVPVLDLQEFRVFLK